MTIKKLSGFIILASILIGMIAAVAIKIGIIPALVTFGLAVLIAGIVVVATWLISS